VVELRPVIDGLTLVAWRTFGLPRFFHRWWARESLGYRVIEVGARAARLDARTRNQIKLVLSGSSHSWPGARPVVSVRSSTRRSDHRRRGNGRDPRRR
jgi:hypothetical protein